MVGYRRKFLCNLESALEPTLSIPKFFTKQTLFIGLLTIAFAITLKGQNYRFKHYTSEDGLYVNTINCVSQDKEGLIWLGTFDGLNRFDGYSFEVIRKRNKTSDLIIDNEIHCLLIDHKSRIWTGGNEGCGYFNYLGGKGTFYTEGEIIGSSLPGKRVRAFGETQGKVWIGTQKGLVYFQESDQRLHVVKHSELSKSQIKQIEGNGKYLYVLSSDGLFRFDVKLGNWETLFKGDEISKIGLLGDNDFIIISKSNKAIKYAIGGKGADTIPINFGSFGIRAIKEDKQGTIWFGTSGGLIKYNPRNRDVRRYEHQEFDERSISSSNILSLFCDRFGLLWISTAAGGVNVIDPTLENFELLQSPAYNGKGIFNNAISSFTEDFNSKLYVGTGNGLTVIDKQAQSVETFFPNKIKNKGPLNAWIRGLCTDKFGKVWIATAGGGISKFDPNNRTFEHYVLEDKGGLLSNYIYSIYCSNRGEIYASSTNGAMIYDRKTNKFKDLSKTPPFSQLEKVAVWKFTEDTEGRLLVCVPSRGVYRFDENKKQVRLFGVGKGADVQIVDIPVWGVYEDVHKQIWFGTNQGLSIYNETEDLVTNMNTETGLADDVIYGFLGDENHHIWMSTNKGLLRYMPETRSFLQYGTEDGLQSKEFNQEAFYEGSDGLLYFGGVKGFNFFDPLRIGVQRKAPTCLITQVSIDEQQQRTAISLNSSKLLYLDYLKQILSVEFGVLNYYLSEKARYRYKLSGQADDWILLGNSNRIVFSNLLPGKYQLEVQASINGNDWSAFPAVLNFVIKPPFFRTWWFILLMVCLLFLLTISIYRMRVRQVRKQAELSLQMSELKMQALRAQMNPHFIFNSLNSIQHLVIKNESQQAFSYLSKFSKLLRMILETSDKPYILLEKEVEVLKLYLELEKLRFDSQFISYFELEDESEWADLKIPTLMLQPFVENAIWHGLLPKEGEKKLWIRIRVKEGYLLLEIEDNGIGRKKSGEIKSLQTVKYESRSTAINENRLNLIEERYRDYSTIEYIDLEESGKAIGTLVKLTFPIQALVVYE